MTATTTGKCLIEWPFYIAMLTVEELQMCLPLREILSVFVCTATSST